MPIPSSSLNVPLEAWQPEGVTIHEGDPRGRGFTLLEQKNGEHFVGVYVFACEPARTSYYLEFNETMLVLEGEVHIELDDGSSVDLAPGDFARLPAGQMSHWWFKSSFKEFVVLEG